MLSMISIFGMKICLQGNTGDQPSLDNHEKFQYQRKRFEFCKIREHQCVKYVVWEICRIKEIAISYIKKRKSKGTCTYPVILMRKVWESGWPGCTGGRGRWPLVQVRVVRLVYHLGATHSSEPLNFGGFYVKLERQEKGSDH